MGSIIHSVPLTNYYRTLSDLLSSEYIAVIPCTQRGIVMANSVYRKGPVLAEDWLTDLTRFDKRSLRRHFPGLERHYTTEVTRWCDAKGPLLAKPISGNSTQGQVLVNTAKEFTQLSDSGKYFFEEWFGSSRRQFSCTVLDKGHWACVERVAQKDGRTSIARKVVDARVLEFGALISSNTNAKSAINFQFAEVDETFLIYDFNPRFGYSELYRTCWGFNFVSKFLGAAEDLSTDEMELHSDSAWSLLRSSAIAASTKD